MATLPQPTQQEILEHAKGQLESLRPRIAVIEATIPKMMTCINRLYTTSQDPDSNVGAYMTALCQACMVMLESNHASLAIQLEEMKKAESGIITMLEESTRMVQVPGLRRGSNVIS